MVEPGFVSGVVEGFYGRPWTLEQRLNLFYKLGQHRMSTYMYAPKDDVKHRVAWRDLYTAEEAEILQQLIASATARHVTFVYALSPGIDICYADLGDLQKIKDKLEQVRSLGCSAFALLFDDIEREMNSRDKAEFVSFAQAQVFVTHSIYNHMGRPQFYFCPTEYCETRADPTIERSEYLNTVGLTLDKEIYVMWTGPCVVTRYLLPEHCRRVGKVLRRKPLIWDNLHANDYDPRRLYLGPFAGRPVELKQTISGLLLNPNNKYEANHIPLLSMADWKRATLDEDDKVAEVEIYSVDDIETDVDDVKTFHPTTSLSQAVDDWLDKFNGTTSPSVELEVYEMYIPDGDSSMCSYSSQPSTSDPNLVEMGDTGMPPIAASMPLPVSAIDEIVRSAVNITQVPENPESTEIVNSLVPEYTESTDMAAPLVRTPRPSQDASAKAEEQIVQSKTIKRGSIQLLIDMYYLPFDYGSRAIEILETCDWIMKNIYRVSDEKSDESSFAVWNTRVSRLRQLISNFDDLFLAMLECPNKSLMSEMIPFVWEVHGMLAVVGGIVSWIEDANLHFEPVTPSKNWEDVDYDGEPWSWNAPVRGFLVDLSNAIASTNDVADFLNNRTLLPLSVSCFSIRTITEEDAPHLAHLFQSADYSLGENVSDSMLYDRYFGLYNQKHFRDSACPRYALAAVERVSNKIICAVSATLDITKFQEEMRPVYETALMEKYESLEKMNTARNNTNLREEIYSWMPVDVNPFVAKYYPSQVNLYAAGQLADAIPAKRLLQTLATVLAYNSSCGMHVVSDCSELQRCELLLKLGFKAVSPTVTKTAFCIQLKDVSPKTTP